MDLVLEEHCQATMSRVFRQTDDLTMAVVHPLTMIETDAMGFVEGNPSIMVSVMSVVLLSRGPPQFQRNFANSRNWRFRLASHGGGAYIREQTVMEGADNMPGAVVYERSDDQVCRKSSAVFGPGDLYCSLWHLLALAGIDECDWTPQYRYWTPPAKMDDGGKNLLE